MKNTKLLYLNKDKITYKQLMQILKKDPNLDSVPYNEAKKYEESLTCKYITIFDSAYPNKLKLLPNPPWLIYYSGNISILSNRLTGIYGSTKPTNYGIKSTRDIIKKEITNDIITCFTYGISKQVILSSKIQSRNLICILASSFSRAYPLSMKDLIPGIIKEGLLISLFPPDSDVCFENYKQQNELLVSLCEDIYIVEAKENSPSMYMALHASEQLKDVYALPGNIYSENSKGTNMLIQEGANVITFD
ncbi:MAG: DNA-processing protein DprA [Mycoplasmatales bacterium]